MNRGNYITFLLAMVMLVTAPVAQSYDEVMAESYRHYFEPFKGKATGKMMTQISSADFVLAARSKSTLHVIDIRTTAESELIGLTVPGSVAVPLHRLFTPEVLKSIPRDRKVVVACKAGHRGMMATTALRHTGFDNVYNLKGGVMALIKHLNPKTAHVTRK